MQNCQTGQRTIPNAQCPRAPLSRLTQIRMKSLAATVATWDATHASQNVGIENIDAASAPQPDSRPCHPRTSASDVAGCIGNCARHFHRHRQPRRPT